MNIENLIKLVQSGTVRVDTTASYLWFISAGQYEAGRCFHLSYEPGLFPKLKDMSDQQLIQGGWSEIRRLGAAICAEGDRLKNLEKNAIAKQTAAAVDTLARELEPGAVWKS